MVFFRRPERRAMTGGSCVRWPPAWGLGEAFAYTHPAEIFDEHARLSGLDNDGQRAFDISGLAGLTRQQYDALAPIQWPVTRSAPRGTPRLFEDGRFFTETAERGSGRSMPRRHSRPPASSSRCA